MTEYLTTKFDLNDPDTVSAIDELCLWSAPFGLLLFKHLKIHVGAKIVDVGCGAGFPLLEVAQRCGSSCQAYGLDIWKAGLDRARFKVKAWRLNNVTLICSDASMIPFKSNQFDLVVSNLGINNFDRPQTVIEECCRITKPSGRLCLTTNPKGHMEEFYEVYASTLEALGKSHLIGNLAEHIDHRVTIDKTCHMMEEAGYRISDIQEETFRMGFLDGSSFLRHYFTILGFLEGWRSLLKPEDEAEVFTRLEDDLNALAELKGELSLTVPMAYIEGEK